MELGALAAAGWLNGVGTYCGNSKFEIRLAECKHKCEGVQEGDDDGHWWHLVARPLASAPFCRPHDSRFT